MKKNFPLFGIWIAAFAIGLNSHQLSADTWGRHPEFELWRQIAISPNKNLAAISGSRDGVELWDIQTNEKKRTVMDSASVGNAAVNSLAFSPDSQFLACGRPKGTALFWDVITGEKKHSLGDYGGLVTTIAFSPDGRVVVGGSRMDIDITPQEEQDKEPPSHLRRFPASAYRRYKTLGEIRARDAQTNNLIWTAKWEHASPSSLAFSPDGSILAAAGNGEVKIYDAKTGELQRRLEGSFSSVCDIVFSPNGKLLAGSNSENAVIVCEVQSGKLKHTLERHKGTVWSVAFSPDSKLIASASSDNTVRLCDSLTGKLKRVFVGIDLRLKADYETRYGDTALREATFSRDGKEIIAIGFGYRHFGGASPNMAIQRWNIAEQPQK